MKLIKEKSCAEFNIITNKKLYKLSLMIKAIFKNSLNKPNILINANSNFLPLACYIKEYANVKVVKNALHGIFSFITHFGCYDLGLFCEKQKGKAVVKFYSGSGYVLSPTVFSILENENKKNFTYKKYNKIKLNISNFDFQNKKFDLFCKKWIKDYCFFYKNKIVNKQDCLVELTNNFEQYLINNIYCGKNTAMFKLIVRENSIKLYKNGEETCINNHLSKNCAKTLKFNEYLMFKNAIELNKDVVECNKNFFVIKDAFTFENISLVVYILNNLL